LNVLGYIFLPQVSGIGSSRQSYKKPTPNEICNTIGFGISKGVEPAHFILILNK
jgi:hypothetical protein